MKLNYQASAYQDRFVAHLLNFKRDGFYLDIGSCHAESCNNTFCFSDLGWNGICIEKDSQHNESYKLRNCVYLNMDALKVDYVNLLETAPKKIDYLSLDIDELSTIVLTMLPLDRFGIVTVEHDQYLHGDIYREEQREILSKTHNLVCADVLVPLADNVQPLSSFEDWWVIRTLEVPEHIYSERLYPADIIKKFQ